MHTYWQHQGPCDKYQAPILTKPDGTQIRLPSLLGEGTPGVVRAGCINGDGRAFKIASLCEATKGVFKTVREEMELERERLAMMDAKWQREWRGERPLRPRLYDAASHPRDGATYREDPFSPLQKYVYLEQQCLNNNYPSLYQLIWQGVGRNMADIGENNPWDDPDSPLESLAKVATLARGRHAAATVLKRAQEKYGMVCPDHGLNNLLINSRCLEGSTTTQTEGRREGGREGVLFKIGVLSESTKGVFKTVYEEMELERQRLAMIDAKWEKEGGREGGRGGGERRPCPRLNDAATHPRDGATYRQTSDSPPQKCVYLEEQYLNSGHYASLHELISKHGYNMADIGDDNPWDDPGSPLVALESVAMLARGLHAAATTLKKARVYRDPISDDPDAYLIDLANTALAKTPGPSMRDDDGALPAPPSQNAALIAIKKAVKKEEGGRPSPTSSRPQSS
ncbi:unnamed protein product [Vitrella brassicaformis CCMP3155]|uniref:Uncharacterized protein n=1 Tax=Vitrella brassicaformis (strain CCMP3155) TaxID=1169540 RepID=A0A0G4F511_VITBC|nr:unnamed protein product [Vitrella brassicaformis CCMP3155]|eukprot:CEM06810.1 unnamed protein product [Vitrella brassicaformis CCMP3155]